jgi:hypothetical protein
VVPAAAGVELADEVEKPRGGRRQVCGELGDLVAKAVQLCTRFDGARLDKRILLVPWNSMTSPS